MKKPFIGILLAVTFTIIFISGINAVMVYADSTENFDADARAGSYIESDLDNDAPEYDSGFSLYSNIPAEFPDNGISDIEDMYPAVRNQNPYGTCWAFASLGMAEFDLINDGTADKNIDLSELQLVNFTFDSVTDPLGGTAGDYSKYDKANASSSILNYGGNFLFASKRLSQWCGAVNESDVPYVDAADVAANGLDDKYAYDYDVAHLHDVYRISRAKNVDEVKCSIMEHGAVGAMYTRYWRGENYIYNSYYDYKGIASGYGDGGHAVMIVGWDDNYSKENFSTSDGVKPGNNGAWLVRNSWGSNFSYFWMSYDTYSLVDTMWVFDFSADDGFDNNYQYDGGLETNVYPWYKTVANVFTVPQRAGVKSETLKAVSLSFMKTADVGYKIEIYTDLTDLTNPKSGRKQEGATTEGRTAFAGIYTIDLENSVDLTPGSSYAVVLTTDKTAIDQESAVVYKDFSTNTKIWDHVVSGDNDRSLYYNGSNFGVWTNNFCIKVFTSNKYENIEQQNHLTAKGYSVELTEYIGANLYVALSSDILEDKGAKVRFKYTDGRCVDESLADFDTTTYNSDTVKKISYKSAPARLTEKVDISIIKSNGTQSNSFAFSPADYLYDLLDKTQKASSGYYELQRNIAKAILNYGTYSQLYFNVNTQELANKGLSDDAVASLSLDDVISATAREDVASLSDDYLEYIGSSLVCTAETGMKLYFVNSNNLSLQQIKNKYDIDILNEYYSRDGKCEYDVSLDGSLLCIKIKNLRSYQIPLKYTVTLKSNYGTLKGVVSPYSYIRKATQSSNVKLQNLCKAMYLYNKAASEYLGR